MLQACFTKRMSEHAPIALGVSLTLHAAGGISSCLLKPSAHTLMLEEIPQARQINVPNTVETGYKVAGYKVKSVSK